MIMSLDTFTYRPSDIDLFGMQTKSKTWEPVKPRFVPLLGGSFIVDGIPVSYKLEGSAEANSSAGLVWGPGRLHDIQAYVTGREAERMRSIRNPLKWIPPLPGMPPPVTLDRPWDTKPNGRFGADGMASFSANASARARAESRLEAELGVFGGLLSAGAFGGLNTSADASARTTIDTFVTATYTDGVITLTAVLDFSAALNLAFSVNAFAGVKVELRLPEIPVVTDLTHRVQSWPIVGWVVPDLSKWRWRKEYRKDWPLFSRSYAWNLAQRFEISAGGSTGSMPETEGFGMDKLLRDVEAAQQAGSLKDDPVGPGTQRRNSDQGAVSAAKAGALAGISSAQRTAEREKKANQRLLARARKAATAATPAAASSAPGAAAAAPPAIASVRPAATPVQQLEERGGKLDDATKSVAELRAKTDALGAPANAQDGTTRNQAQSGYDSVAANADALGDAIDDGAQGFAIPPAVEPADADYAKLKEAMHRAYTAFDEAVDPIRTEKLYADDQVREAGSSADLAAYRNAALTHQSASGALWKRVQKLESDLERAREWYEKGDFALGATVFTELEGTARRATTESSVLKANRPVGDWDLDYVELDAGQLVLKSQYRGKATRSYFYPHDYSAGTKARMMAEIGSFRTEEGVVYWEWRGGLSSRGDHWWKLNDPQEMPTLDHTAPTVLGQWNSAGRTTAYAPRRSFYDFVGAGLTVVPKQRNSSAGGKEPDSYTPRVTRSFRGAKT